MMRMEKAGEQRRQLRKTQAEWESRKNYRVWDANRKIFLYPENWIEPELRLSTRFRAALNDVVAFICAKCGAKTKRKPVGKLAHRKSVRVLLTGRIEKYVGLAILASGNRTKIASGFSRRFHFVISIRPRRKARRSRK